MKVLFLLVCVCQSSFAQQGWLTPPTDTIYVQYHYTDNDEVDSAKYSNGVEYGWAYDTMSNRSVSVQNPAPPKAEFVIRTGTLPAAIGIGTTGTAFARLVSENVGVKANVDASNATIPFTVQIYLSANDRFDGVPIDTLLGTLTYGQVFHVGDSLVSHLPLIVPPQLSTGWHKLLFVIDRDIDFVPEYEDTTNNVFVTRGYFAPCTAPIMDTLTSTATCGYANGSIRFVPSPDMTYEWHDGATMPSRSGLSSGLYLLHITNNMGCRTQHIFNVENTPPLTATTASTPRNCNRINGVATIQPQGGTPPYNYMWQNGSTTASITGLNVGNYPYTVTDSLQCQQYGVINIQSVAIPTVIIQTQIATCGNNNGIASAQVSAGIAPYSFVWSNGATTSSIQGLAEGNYNLTMTDASGCSVIRSANIQQTAGLSASGSVNSITQLITAHPQNGTFPFRYLWNTGQSTSVISYTPGGFYSVTITDANGCTAVWDNTMTGVEEDPTSNSLKVFPNPTQGLVTVEYTDLPLGMTCKVYDANGALLQKQDLVARSGSLELDLSSYPSASYLITICDQNGLKLHSKTIILNR